MIKRVLIYWWLDFPECLFPLNRKCNANPINHFHRFLLIIITKSGDSLIGDIDQTFVSVWGQARYWSWQRQNKQLYLLRGKTLPNKSHWGGKVLVLDVAKKRCRWLSSTKKIPYHAIMQEEMFYKPPTSLSLPWLECAILLRAFLKLQNFTGRFFETAKTLAKYLADASALQRKWKLRGRLWMEDKLWMEGYRIACTFPH